MTNSQILRGFRDEQKMSLRTFGDKMGFSLSYIADVESGKREVSRNFADTAYRIFGLNLHVHRFVCTDCHGTGLKPGGEV